MDETTFKALIIVLQTFNFIGRIQVFSDSFQTALERLDEWVEAHKDDYPSTRES